MRYAGLIRSLEDIPCLGMKGCFFRAGYKNIAFVLECPYTPFMPLKPRPEHTRVGIPWHISAHKNSLYPIEFHLLHAFSDACLCV